ncbi:MAG: ERF family protein, partial [Bacteroidales bacterium]
MSKSESIQLLAAALSKAQAEMPAIKFDSKNPFLKNDYASLGAIIAGARPVIAKHGLSVSQLTFGEDGVAGVETVLMHASGEWISNSISMPIGEEKGKSSAQ